MIRGTSAIGAAAVVVVMGLTGCAPATAPDHTPAAVATPVATATPPTSGPPALSDLVLSPNGLGPVVIGAPVPGQGASTAIMIWDQTKCSGNGAWLPNYPAGPIGPGGDPTGAPFYFAVDHKSDALSYLNVSSTQIKTGQGIFIGSTVDQVKAAYSHFDAIVTGPLTDLYEINGPMAKLVIEVERPGNDSASANKVVLMEVNPLGSAPGSLFGNDAGGGICPPTD